MIVGVTDSPWNSELQMGNLLSKQRLHVHVRLRGSQIQIAADPGIAAAINALIAVSICDSRVAVNPRDQR